MNENNDNFGDLKKLLKLKRHEIPPPGYFNRFSDGVIAHIQAGETRGAKFETESPFIRFLRFFELHPGVVGGFATSLCLVLLFGVVMAERSDDSTTPDIFNTVKAGGQPMTASLSGGVSSADNLVASAQTAGGITVSTNPLTSLQPSATLFGQANPLFQTASFGH